MQYDIAAAYHAVYKEYLSEAQTAANPADKQHSIRRAALAWRIRENVIRLGSQLGEDGRIQSNFPLKPLAEHHGVMLTIVIERDIPDLEARLRRHIPSFTRHKIRGIR